MIDYTIAAIPTVYRGRLYRSRLEARWATFFDLLRWRHEYEPFDLGSWSPDFLLDIEVGADWPIYTEIKPINAFNHKVWAKAWNALGEAGYLAPDARGGLLLLGVAPVHFCGQVAIGYYETLSGDNDAYSVILAWVDGNPTLLSMRGEWHSICRPDRPLQENDHGNAIIDGELIVSNAANERFMEIWAEASNRVQWHPKGRLP